MMVAYVPMQGVLIRVVLERGRTADEVGAAELIEPRPTSGKPISAHLTEVFLRGATRSLADLNGAPGRTKEELEEQHVMAS
jgi:hypothetical protein